MNDSWSSEERGAEVEQGSVTTRRRDRHAEPDAHVPGSDARRYPWVGLVLLIGGLVAAGVGLVWIGTDLDRPGIARVDAARWWLVAGGGLVVAWSAPWFLLPRGRRRMAIVLGACTAAVLAVAAISIGGMPT